MASGQVDPFHRRPGSSPPSWTSQDHYPVLWPQLSTVWLHVPSSATFPPNSHRAVRTHVPGTRPHTQSRDPKRVNWQGLPHDSVKFLENCSNTSFTNCTMTTVCLFLSMTHLLHLSWMLEHQSYKNCCAFNSSYFNDLSTFLACELASRRC